MRKRAKLWLIIAASLIVIGGSLFAAVMTAYHWDFTKLSTEHYNTNTYAISEEFRRITINTDTADILFAASDGNMCSVVCYEPENLKHTVDVHDGTLAINAVDGRQWYEMIGLHSHSPKVTLYLPKAEYASLVIKESTGDIEIPKDFSFENADISLTTGNVKLFSSAAASVGINITTGDIMVSNLSAGAIDLSASTGDIIISDVTCPGDLNANVTTGEVTVTNAMCKSLLSSGDTGDLSLKNVTAAEKLSIARSTGDVRFDGVDAAALLVKTDTGNVTGSLRSQKVFITETSTGRISVPKTTAGGTCEITTSTGDIHIEIAE